jgi:hypothetical protein
LSRSYFLGLFVLAIFGIALALAPAPAFPASPADFSFASGSIGAAYVAVSHAQQDGGNVSGLVANLNVALGLYMRAQAENPANPSRASSDLQNATQIAQHVALEAPAVGGSGLAARRTQEYLSVGSAAAVLAVAAALYIYGERIYHMVWLRLHSGHVVKKVG